MTSVNLERHLNILRSKKANSLNIHRVLFMYKKIFWSVLPDTSLVNLMIICLKGISEEGFLFNSNVKTIHASHTNFR